MQIHKAHGFTLIEMMLVLLISAGILSAGYTLYLAQQRTYQQQEQVIELQQNIRAILYFIEKDLRMAGYDPQKTGTPGFLIAQPAEIAFSADLGRPRGDSNCGSTEACDSMSDGAIIDIAAACDDCIAETIRYALKTDGDKDGIAGSGYNPPKATTSITKVFNGTSSTSSNPAQDIIEGVEAIEFLYNLNDGNAATAVTGADLKNIRSVTISMLIRTRNHIVGKLPSVDQYFYPASNADAVATEKKWGPFKDSYMRRLIITNVLCRNMALQSKT